MRLQVEISGSLADIVQQDGVHRDVISPQRGWPFDNPDRWEGPRQPLDNNRAVGVDYNFAHFWNMPQGGNDMLIQWYAIQ